jgi:hypothetical protein
MSQRRTHSQGAFQPLSTHQSQASTGLLQAARPQLFRHSGRFKNSNRRLRRQNTMKRRIARRYNCFLRHLPPYASFRQLHHIISAHSPAITNISYHNLLTTTPPPGTKLLGLGAKFAPRTPPIPMSTYISAGNALIRSIKFHDHFKDKPNNFSIPLGFKLPRSIWRLAKTPSFYSEWAWKILESSVNWRFTLSFALSLAKLRVSWVRAGPRMSAKVPKNILRARLLVQIQRSQN